MASKELEAATPGDSLAAEISGTIKDVGFKVSATGFYAAVVAVAGALAAELIWLDLKNLQHLILIVLTSVVGGVLGGTGLMKARLDDAHRHIERLGKEVDRLADQKAALEEKLLVKRLSSGKGKG